MLTEERYEIILKLLDKKRSVTVAEIKDLLKISESTIRRDLTALDREGRLTKVFGGAVALEYSFNARELSVPQKLKVHEKEKRAIARYAASLIKPSDFVYIDAGTTTSYIIDYITENEVSFVTNAVDHARRLAVAGYHVVLTGGLLKGTTEAIIGSQAILSIQEFHFSKGFFGANGISAMHGITTPDGNEALVKKTALKQCNRKLILADSSKYGEVSSVTFASFGEVEIISENIPPDYKRYNNIYSASK